MAKDSQGIELAVGDIVTIQATVTQVGDKALSIGIDNWSWISCPASQVTKVVTEVVP